MSNAQNKHSIFVDLEYIKRMMSSADPSMQTDKFTNHIANALKQPHGEKAVTELFFYACKHNAGKELLHALHDIGFDFNAKLHSGITPLQYMVNIDNPEYINLLVKQYNANINAIDDNGQTCLHIVREKPRSTTARIQELLDLGADPNIPDNKGKRPADYFVNGTNLELITLLAKHTRLDTVVDGSTLMEKIGQHDTMDDHEANKMYLDLFNHYFAKGDRNSAKLVMQEALKYPPESNGLPNHFIYDFIRQPSSADTKSKLVMLSDMICEQNPLNKELLHFLIFEGINMGGESIDHDSKKADIIFTNLVFNHSIDLSQPTTSGFTPLQIAVNVKKPAMIDMLVDYGAKPNTLNEKGDTALHLAIRSGGLRKLALIKRLMAREANVNHVNGNGERPLELVADGGDLDLIKFLARYTLLDKDNPKDKALIDRLNNNDHFSPEQIKSIKYKTPSRPNTPDSTPDHSPESSPKSSPRKQ